MWSFKVIEIKDVIIQKDLLIRSDSRSLTFNMGRLRHHELSFNILEYRCIIIETYSRNMYYPDHFITCYCYFIDFIDFTKLTPSWLLGFLRYLALKTQKITET